MAQSDERAGEIVDHEALRDRSPKLTQPVSGSRIIQTAPLPNVSPAVILVPERRRKFEEINLFLFLNILKNYPVPDIEGSKNPEMGLLRWCILSFIKRIGRVLRVRWGRPRVRSGVVSSSTSSPPRNRESRADSL